MYGKMRMHSRPSNELLNKKKERGHVSLPLSMPRSHVSLSFLFFFFCFSSYLYILNCHHDFEYSTMRIDIQNHGSLHLCEHERVDKRTDSASFRFMFSFSCRTFTPSLPSLSLSLCHSLCVNMYPTHSYACFLSRSLSNLCERAHARSFARLLSLTQSTSAPLATLTLVTSPSTSSSVVCPSVKLSHSRHPLDIEIVLGDTYADDHE